MLYLTEDDVRRFLPMRDCIGLMRDAFARLGAGQAINQPRRRLVMPTRTTLHYMVAADGPYFGAKVYSFHPKHGGRFLFLLYRAEDAALIAMIEANYLGQIRTGAASGLATQLMARPESRVVAVIGSGFQARAQVDAMAAALKVDEVRVWSRSAEKRARFAAECSEGLGVKVVAADTAEQAVRGADVVVTATYAAEPVLDAAWVAAGTHINAMGSNQAKRREIPGELVLRAGTVVVDSREQSLMEAGDLLLAFQPGDWDRVIELQDVVGGKPGRQRTDEITLFKSNGLALEDVAAAGYVYERAMQAGAGRESHS